MRVPAQAASRRGKCALPSSSCPRCTCSMPALPSQQLPLPPSARSGRCSTVWSVHVRVSSKPRPLAPRLPWPCAGRAADHGGAGAPVGGRLQQHPPSRRPSTPSSSACARTTQAASRGACRSCCAPWRPGSMTRIPCSRCSGRRIWNTSRRALLCPFHLLGGHCPPPPLWGGFS